jgi:hypothetical protein
MEYPEQRAVFSKADPKLTFSIRQPVVEQPAIKPLQKTDTRAKTVTAVSAKKEKKADEDQDWLDDLLG